MSSIHVQVRALAQQAGQVLSQVKIDENGPGTVLRDFDMLLGYIAEQSPQVTPTGQLSLKALPGINARLTHPLRLGLRRPKLKSFPHIEGLYLLVRASGLTYIDMTGKPRLFVDESILQSWRSLNATERYGTLLEAWLLRGRPEIVGERGSRLALIPDNLSNCLFMLFQIPAGGKAVDDQELQEWLSYAPGAYNVGLLDLFGIVDVQRAAPEPGKGWRVERIARTLFGTALFALLQAEFFGDFDRIHELAEEEEMPFGVLQPILQPYFPEWNNNLASPHWAFREGAHVFDASLGRTSRRIAMPAEATLDALAMAILDAFDFDYDHLYEFVYLGHSGTEEHINHPATDEEPFTSEVRVGDVPLRIGQAMTFVYDFGDWWTFSVTLAQVDPAMQIGKPKLLESHGRAPRQYPSWDEEEEEEYEEEEE